MMAARGPGRGRAVLLVLHGEEVGGASLSALRLVPLLAEFGWRVVAWAPRPSDLIEEVRSRGVPVFGEPRPISGYSLAAMRVPPGPLPRLMGAPRYYASLSRVLRAERPVLAHCNSLYTLDEAAWIRAHGLPTVMHVHEMIGRSRKQRVARDLLHRVGNVVVGVSEASVRSLGGGTRPVRLVREGVAIPESAPDRSKRRERVRVGTVGVIARRKGTDLFVEAARRVRAEAPNVEFELVGAATDPLEKAWAHRVLGQAEAAGVEYTERCDVPSKLGTWDIFVLPSRVDPFPIVVLEAMASALPVVGTRVDGIPEQVSRRTGRLVPSDDANALAGAILELARDRELRVSLGAEGRTRAAQEFSLERQARGISEVYLSALGEAGSNHSPR
jgi:glycosyltransferase involved in cell wall biosynthesis